MSGSSASNLGYGNITPNSNINSLYVNKDASNWPGSFGSNEISGSPPGIFPHGLAGAKYNVDAAAGNVPGICLQKGGRVKILKRKIKNITKQYKRMRAGSKKIRSMKKYLRSKAISGGKRSRKYSKRHRKQRGGYAQYQNNLPMTPVYSVGASNLPSNLLALANPPPITRLSNCVNCVDNYNHYTNMGFPSKGH